MQMEALEAVHRESRRLPPIQKVSVALFLAAGTSVVCTVQIGDNSISFFSFSILITIPEPAYWPVLSTDLIPVRKKTEMGHNSLISILHCCEKNT